MTEADVTIDKAIESTEEIFDSPIGIGEAAGIGEPVPYRLRMPVKRIAKADWPVAVIWLHPFDLSVAAKLRDAGINPDPGLKDIGEIARQNAALAPLIIDKGKGWTNLFRTDGSEWKYIPCSKDDDGSRADCRVQLSELGAMFGLIKARAISIAFSLASEIEGNSESSSVTPTVVRVEPSGKPGSSPEN